MRGNLFHGRRSCQKESKGWMHKRHINSKCQISEYLSYCGESLTSDFILPWHLHPDMALLFCITTGIFGKSVILWLLVLFWVELSVQSTWFTTVQWAVLQYCELWMLLLTKFFNNWHRFNFIDVDICFDRNQETCKPGLPAPPAD